MAQDPQDQVVRTKIYLPQPDRGQGEEADGKQRTRKKGEEEGKGAEGGVLEDRGLPLDKEETCIRKQQVITIQGEIPCVRMGI